MKEENFNKKLEKHRKSLYNYLGFIKGIVFDFDNTLEVWSSLPEKQATNEWLKIICKNENINYFKFKKVFNEIKQYQLVHSYCKGTNSYSRALWLKLTIEKINKLSTKRDHEINLTHSRILRYEDMFWRICLKYIRLYKGVKSLLFNIKQKKLKIGLVSDSDGKKKYKINRIKKLGIYGYFDSIVTADDTKKNKPDLSIFKLISKKLSLKPSQLIMVGDSPEKDLINAKKLGMITVLIKQAKSYKLNINNYSYIDYSLKSIRDFRKIIVKINKYC